jgi:polyphosphate kinase
MDRNFFRRVEVAFPILDEKLKKRVIQEAFTFALNDNQLAWLQQKNGDYIKLKNRKPPFSLHEALILANQTAN